MRLISLLLLGTLSSAASAAQVYRWTDSSGAVHYGDRPRQGAVMVDVQPTSGDGGLAVASSADAAARAEACAKEQTNLQQLKASVGIRLIDKDFKVHDYTPDERDQYIARSEKRVAELCAQ